MPTCKICGQRSAWKICGECDPDYFVEKYGKTLEELEDEDRAAREDEACRRYHEGKEDGKW